MATKYSFPNICAPDRLTIEIVAESFNVELDHIDVGTNPKNTDIWFVNFLSSDEEIKLENVFASHLKTINDKVTIDSGKVSLVDDLNTPINQIDTDNAWIVRIKAAKKGWSFWAAPLEITTSTIGGSLYFKDVDGVGIPGVTCKIYNNSDEEITTPGILNANLNTCVKTVLDFEMPFDLEMIGGELRINSNPVQDIRLWIVGAPDIPAEFGGSREFASGVNLKFLTADESFSVDGRVTKYITYSPTTHSGKIRILLKHPAGSAVNMQFVIHTYRQ